MMDEEVRTREVENEEISVKKAATAVDGERLRIEFTVTTACHDPVAYRLVDELPAEVAVTDVRFHSEHKLDNWTLHEDCVILSDVVTRGETECAFYYVRTSRPEEEVTVPLPEIAATLKDTDEMFPSDEPPLWRSDDTIGGLEKRMEVQAPIPDRLVDDGTTGDPSSEPRGLAISELFEDLQDEYDRQEYAEFGETVEEYYPSELTFDELLAIDEATEEPAKSSRDHLTESEQRDNHPHAHRGETSGSDDTIDGESSVLVELTRELEERDPSSPEIVAFRQALETHSGGRVTAQIRHLQSQISDLTAYTDALELFLDDNGTADQLLATLEEDLARVDARLDRLEKSLGEQGTRHTDLDERVDAIAETVDGVHEDVSDLQDATTQHAERAAEIDRRLDTLADNDDELALAVERIETTHKYRLNSLEDQLEVLEEQHDRFVDKLRSTFAASP